MNQSTFLLSRTQSVPQDALYSLAGFALLVVAAQISIPLHPVPITLQSMMVLLIGLKFSRRSALSSVALYLFAGALGAPVLQGWSGGLTTLIGATGGYLLGFFAAVYVMTTLRNHLRLDSLPGMLLNCTLGTAIVLGLGVLWLATFVGFAPAIQLGLVPFVLPGVVKAGLLCASLRYLSPR